ncbi:hypothetical protein, partial [Bacillus halotolerans]|uniref:hypothetical protein n=1 Tax=Bacillus halotolerans TaxID=260554 RepID=UPI002159917A
MVTASITRSRSSRAVGSWAGSGVVADVVVGLGHPNVELRVGRNLEAVACAGRLPFIGAVELVFARAAHAF